MQAEPWCWESPLISLSALSDACKFWAPEIFIFLIYKINYPSTFPASFQASEISMQNLNDDLL